MSLVAFKARNHQQQSVRDSVDDRSTPRPFFDPLNAVHRFTLDAAASDDNTLLPKYFTRERSGLLGSWVEDRVWCNPPYSRLTGWVEKAWLEMQAGCELIVMLLPANRTEQTFWKTYVEPYRDGGGGRLAGVSLRSRFVARRLHLLPPPGYSPGPSERKRTGPPFGSVLLTWDRQ